jgi:hypothetical protein
MIDLSPQPTHPPVEGSFVYLGCPYTNPDPDVQLQRVELASIVAARLMLNGFAVYSPITHGHQVAQHIPQGEDTGHDFWMGQCLPMLAKASALVILPMAGWRQSRGLRDEMALAQRLHIPIGVIQRIAEPWHQQLDKVLSVELALLGAQHVRGLETAGGVVRKGEAA